jgi:hypothetical protein
MGKASVAQCINLYNPHAVLTVKPLGIPAASLAEDNFITGFHHIDSVINRQLPTAIVSAGS